MVEEVPTDIFLKKVDKLDSKNSATANVSVFELSSALMTVEVYQSRTPLFSHAFPCAIPYSDLLPVLKVKDNH